MVDFQSFFLTQDNFRAVPLFYSLKHVCSEKCKRDISAVGLCLRAWSPSPVYSWNNHQCYYKFRCNMEQIIVEWGKNKLHALNEKHELPSLHICHILNCPGWLASLENCLLLKCTSRVQSKSVRQVKDGVRKKNCLISPSTQSMLMGESLQRSYCVLPARVCVCGKPSLMGEHSDYC